MPEQRQLPLDLHLDMFVLHQRASHHTESTVELYQRDLGRFVEHLKEAGISSTVDITAHHIRQYMAKMEQRGLAATTIHISARCIKTWCNFLVNEEILSRSPMRTVKMPKLEEKILPPFSENDIRQLLKACVGEFQRRDRAIILCLLDTGLRASEFLSLTVDSIDRDGAIRMMGKGRKERWTRRYLKFEKEDLLRAHARASPVDNWKL